jgi:hypothetical protein
MQAEAGSSPLDPDSEDEGFLEIKRHQPAHRSKKALKSCLKKTTRGGMREEDAKSLEAEAMRLAISEQPTRQTSRVRG